MSGDALTPEMRRAIAAWLRNGDSCGNYGVESIHEWADALDPRPTLRDAVAAALRGSGEVSSSRAVRLADAALAVVREFAGGQACRWPECECPGGRVCAP